MGFFELTDAAAMLRKARRELDRLAHEPSIDHVFNFFVTAHSVTDYLKGAVPESDRSALLAEPDIQLCRDVSNKAKHMKLDRGRPDPATHHVSGALGSAAFNTVAFNASGERWVRWPDGTELEMMTFGTAVLKHLEQFLSTHGIAF
ncbi:hypothetical protein C6T65_12110 [Burkholderia vietnamiensis]|uniref:Uncharacterized protein n=1 Tax=Burkholderia vietnamiensis TaxID=60552 RepID=A0AA44Y4Z3_BURVI|nr:hypothetical protein [Burkholderia vietnamiensis]PRH42092.1 hypothetical protein C6T65_12110 [Burkholderia vietnamiensis]